MDENHMQAFLTVAKEKNFSQAAKLLYVSQPSISKRIKILEQELGYDLFIRSKNHVELSQDGKKFFPYAQQALDFINKGRSVLGKDFISTIDRPLRIGTSTILSFYILPPILYEFKSRFPHVQIELTTRRTNDIHHLISNEEIDLGIIQKINTIKNIKTIPLFQDQYTLVINKNRLQKGQTFNIQDFSKQPVIQYSKGDFWVPIENLFRKHNINLNCTVQSDSAESIKRLVKSGMGLSFLPNFVIKQEPENELFTTVQIDHITLPYSSVSLVFLNKNEKLARSFVKSLQY